MNPEETQNVETSINLVIDRFRRSPNVILTEDDFRFHLCSCLLRHFGIEEDTQDGDKSISLHSEIRWYGNGNLRTRSDIVLIDVSNLDVLHHPRLPSKGFGFNIPKAIIEIKLRRSNGESDAKFLEAINADVRKLSELKQVFYNAQGREQTSYWLLVLDKKSDLTGQIHEPEGIQIRYEGTPEKGRRGAQGERRVSP